jgi:maltose alpha-D-glucosyltransferase/alpha-amylase
LFLRNHDELTLEMVTDEERDYMYQAYAADPQMRLNLGIRRRLAPLMENSRRRIELLNSLLFSMPGTPIVYYGDEIGMGDNIYLGDRNGVRTPMQWSGDRNGGFSRADTARLFAPPIMDPVYGYQAINVEAQERYPFSLLNWMKRLIATRKQHRVFGRGSLEFVGCSNRKILAYLRRDDRETVLVVANLSRSFQPAELDLRAFVGLVPVEMNGLTEFPRVSDRPYFLTLGPYACYWFMLQHEGMQVTQLAARPGPADPHTALAAELPALLVGVDWEGVLDSASRFVLERQALAPYLTRQRWFASKSREIKQARFSDWTMIRGGATPSFVTMASVAYADGWVETYLMPLALASGQQAQRVLKESTASVLARITGARKGVLMDGLLDDDTCDRLLQLIQQGGEVASTRGGIRGLRVDSQIELPDERRWTRPGGDQSNSLAFVGDRYVLKLFRRVEPGPNPEYEISRVLLERGFTRAPTLGGALVYDRPGLEPGTLAVLQTAVQHQGSAWEFTVDELRRYYERVLARITRTGALPQPPADALPAGEDFLPSEPRSFTMDILPPWAHAAGLEPSAPPPFFAALENWYLTSAHTLGKRTAEFHQALASSHDPAFVPRPLTGDGLHTLADGLTAHAQRMLDLLASKIGTLSDAARPQAEEILAARERIMARLDAVRRCERAGQSIRIHGDYHLGQVLRTEEDFVLLDFEGEPARPLEERRARQSPIKDVAGMVRSFSYAAYASLFAFTLHAPDSYASLAPWADTWEHWVADAFLNGYRSAPAPFMPEGADLETMLRAFALDKALYELGYELNSRPDWVRIPLVGILKVV